MCRLFHKWQLIADTGVFAYRECRNCGERKVTRIALGLQPTNERWLRHKADDFYEPMQPPPCRPKGPKNPRLIGETIKG